MPLVKCFAYVIHAPFSVLLCLVFAGSIVFTPQVVDPLVIVRSVVVRVRKFERSRGVRSLVVPSRQQLFLRELVPIPDDLRAMGARDGRKSRPSSGGGKSRSGGNSVSTKRWQRPEAQSRGSSRNHRCRDQSSSSSSSASSQKSKGYREYTKK